MNTVEELVLANDDYGNNFLSSTTMVYCLTKGSYFQIKSPMPTPRQGLATAVANGKIYAIGGYNNGQLNTVEEYDPVTNTWIAKANMPTSRYNLAAVAVNGKIYAIGGYSNGYSNKVEEYNPATNTWTTKASMPTSRTRLAVTAVNGKIYAIGGNGMKNITLYQIRGCKKQICLSQVISWE